MTLNLGEMADNAVPVATLVEGEEAQVEITKVDNQLDNQEKPYLMLTLSNLDLDGNYADIREFVDTGERTPPFVKNEADERKWRNTLATKMKAFFESFDIQDEDRNIPETWEGKTGTIIAKVKDDAKYGLSNNVKRYVGTPDGA